MTALAISPRARSERPAAPASQTRSSHADHTAHFHDAAVSPAARDELSLTWLRADAVAAGLRVTSFHEPDLNDALTALALESAASRLLAGLPLALTGSLTSARRGEVRT